MIIVDKILEGSIEQTRGAGVIRASELGHPCTRKLQYVFKNPLPRTISRKSLFVMESGVKGEEQFIKRLPEGFKIKDQQKEFKFGNLIGHIDGILVCPDGREYIWEHKVCGEDKFNKAKKGIALLSWDETYYMQAFAYMYMSGFKQHLTTIELSGGRDYTEILTEYNLAHEEKFLAKIKSVESDVMMPTLPKWQQNIYCKNCEYYERCFNS